MPFFNTGFNVSKVKSRLKMTASRLDIDSAKKTALMKQNMREVAELLAEDPPKEEKARLRAEALIRDDNTLVACDILRLECLLLMERVSLMSHCAECPPDLVSLVSDLIFAAPRLGIAELTTVRKQLRAKYGRDFKTRAMNNEGGILNEKIVQNLSLQPATKQTVNLYMEKICKQYEVDWQPTIELDAQAASIPVTTGMVETDDNIIAKRVQYLGSMEVLPPPPFAPCHSGNDAASTTSSSSRDNNGDEPPPGGAPMAIAMPVINR